MGKLTAFWLMTLMAFVPSMEGTAIAEEVAMSLLKFTQKFSNAYIHGSHATGTGAYSPFLIYAALGMAKAGARGDTATEIQKVMGAPDDGTLFNGYHELVESIHGDEHFTLKTVSVVAAKAGFEIQPAFKETLKSKFNAAAHSLDYSNAQETADHINTYASGSTGGTIPGVMTVDMVSKLKSLYVYNAIYFKGHWETEFKKEDTQEGDWHKDSKTTIKVPMMKLTTELAYASCPELNAKVVGLPYKGGQTWMLIAIPNDPEGLPALNDKLKDYPLHEVRAKMGKRKIQLTIPKFKIESEIDCKDALIALGAPSMFDKDKADFSGVPVTPTPLYVDEAIQKVFFSIDEEGAEAAARRGLHQGPRGRGIERTEEINVNHPFAFAISKYGAENEPRIVLFAGRVSDPTQHK